MQNREISFSSAFLSVADMDLAFRFDFDDDSRCLTMNALANGLGAVKPVFPCKLFFFHKVHSRFGVTDLTVEVAKCAKFCGLELSLCFVIICEGKEYSSCSQTNNYICRYICQ